MFYIGVTEIYEQFSELKYKYRNREFWCKGYMSFKDGKADFFGDKAVRLTEKMNPIL